MPKQQISNLQETDDQVTKNPPESIPNLAKPPFEIPISVELLKLKTALQLQARKKEIEARGKFEKSFLYLDKEGELLFEVFQYESKKRLLKKLNGEDMPANDKGLVLYNLPGINRDSIFYTTDEKNADTLIALNLPATTNPCGILPAWNKSFSKALLNKEVIIIPNKSYQERTHAQWVIENLVKENIKNIKILHLPNLEEEGEVHQWIAAQKEAGKSENDIKSELHTLVKERTVDARFFIQQMKMEARQRRDDILKNAPTDFMIWQGRYTPKPFKGKVPVLEFVNEAGEVVKKPIVHETSAHIKNQADHVRFLPIERPGSSTNGQNGNTADPFVEMAEEIYKRGNGSKNPLGYSPSKITDTAFFDFAFYEFMMPFSQPFIFPEVAGDIDVNTGWVYLYRLFRERIIYEMTSVILVQGSSAYDWKLRIADTQKKPDFPDYLKNLNCFEEAFAQYFYDFYFIKVSSDLLGLFVLTLPDFKDFFYLKFRSWFWQKSLKWYSGENTDIDSDWKNLPLELSDLLQQYIGSTETIPAPEFYKFTPFSAPSVNFGLRILHRQYWQNQGTQDGEIVKTIPLGPKQVEKVSTKISRKSLDKRSREAVVGKDIETESSESTKDSQDIVREAAQSENWHVEASASYDVLFSSGSVTAGAGGESSSSSKDAKNKINEIMEKTASKIHSETKAIVSTEREATFEEERASEISNPNEELAITYVYKKLMKQYRITTKMAEVNSVVFVGEPVPDPSEIDADWIRRYDDILVKVLLDPSIANDLNLLRSEVDELTIESVIDKTITVDEVTSDFFKALASEAKSKLGYSGSGTIPDIFKTPQDSFVRELDRQRELKRREEQRTLRLIRVSRHIKDNILHYMRAIWRAEDPDARLQRFSQMIVPIKWTMSDADGDGNVEFTPILDDSKFVLPLSEVIHPAGLLGFAGNYAVYLMKSNPNLVDLNNALAVLRQEYSHRKIAIQPGSNNKGKSKIIECSLYKLKGVTTSSFKFELVKEVSRKVDLKITNLNSSDSLTIPAFYRFLNKIFIIDRWGFTFTLTNENNALSDEDISDQWIIKIGQEVLRDPELTQIIKETPLPATEEEVEVYTPEVLMEMASFFPRIADRLMWLEEVNEPASWSQQPRALQELVREHYHEYLLHKRYTQTILIDTNNLMVDLKVGSTSALEEFKRLHRYVDVMKAHIEKEKLEVEKVKLELEVEKLRLENERRQKMIEAGKLGDPDIEKVTVIGKDTELRDVVNVEMAEDNTDDN